MFSSNFAQYRIERLSDFIRATGETIQRFQVTGPDGSDTVSGVEQFQFADPDGGA